MTWTDYKTTKDRMGVADMPKWLFVTLFVAVSFALAFLIGEWTGLTNFLLAAVDTYGVGA